MRRRPDIVIPPTEAPIVGPIPGLRDRKAVQQVINQLLGRKS